MYFFYCEQFEISSKEGIRKNILLSKSQTLFLMLTRLIVNLDHLDSNIIKKSVFPLLHEIK